MKFGSIIVLFLLLCNSSYAQLDKFSIGINVQPLTQYIYHHADFYLIKYKPQLGINIDYSLNNNHRISLAVNNSNTHFKLNPNSTSDIKFMDPPGATKDYKDIEVGILYSYKTSNRKKLNMLFSSGIYSMTLFYTSSPSFRPFVYLGTGIDYKVSNKISFSFVPNARVLMPYFIKRFNYGAKLGLNYTPFG